MTGLAYVLFIFLGFAGGIAVGGGFAAFITVLDIVPRLAQLTRTYAYVSVYEWSVISGVLFFTGIDLLNIGFHLPDWCISVFGALMGAFVGLLAAALTEVVNVIPILAKRLRVQEQLTFLLIAMVLGKMAGSLLQWLVF
jgi:stage V sporulation protein AB